MQRRKRAPFLYPLFPFFGRGRGFTSPAARNCEQTYLLSVAFLCVVLRTRNCRRQTLSCLLAAASVATQKPSPVPLHVRSCCTACRSRFGAYTLHIFLIYSRRKFANLKTKRRFASAKLCRHLSRRRG